MKNKHWKDQPRDPGGKGGGQWIRAAGRSLAGRRLSAAGKARREHQDARKAAMPRVKKPGYWTDDKFVAPKYHKMSKREDKRAMDRVAETHKRFQAANRRAYGNTLGNARVVVSGGRSIHRSRVIDRDGRFYERD